MSELVSAYPTAGGIYWWAATMGKPIHGWFTGWLNLIGLIAVTASVDYGCATFLNLIARRAARRLGRRHAAPGVRALRRSSWSLHALINIFGHSIIDVLQNVSVWWHVFGAAAVVLILVVRAGRSTRACSSSSPSASTTPASSAAPRRLPFWFYVLPLGFLLTQYTITGFDACAHVSEETKGASTAAAKGLWQSIFYSAIGGWILLLAFLFAANDVDAINDGGGFVRRDLRSAR